MNEITVFENDQFGQVRTTIDEKGTPLFCGADIASALGYQNPSREVQRHCLYPQERQTTDLVGRQTTMLFIPEPDVYRLVIRSNKPEAVAFEKWLMEEVLPAIRRTGSYLPAKGSTEYLCATDTLIRLAQEVKDARLELSQQQARYNAIARDAYRTPEDLEDLYNADNIGMLLPLKTTAKLLGVPIRTFTNLLTDNGILYRNRNYTLMPKGDYNRKHFVVREYYDLDGTGYGMETLTTPEGREAIRQLVDRELE